MKKEDIELMMLYRSQINEKYSIIVNRLLYKLKHPSVVKIFARKCKVVEPSYKECKEFLDEFHFQGNLMSKIRVGLEYNGLLVSLLVFSHSRYNPAYSMEIGRYVVRGRYNIPGNFSKMMKYFIAKYNPENILTYHDKLFGFNSVYESNGFFREEDSTSGFFWFKDFKMYNRRSFWKMEQPKKLEHYDPNLTAHQNMYSHGFVKCWELGSGKYGYRCENWVPTPVVIKEPEIIIPNRDKEISLLDMF